MPVPLLAQVSKDRRRPILLAEDPRTRRRARRYGGPPQLRITDEPLSARRAASRAKPVAKADDGRGAPGGARKGWPPVATCPVPAVQLGSAHQFRDSSRETLIVGGNRGHFR